MALIPMSDLTTLISASAAKAVADTAVFEHEKQSVAALINNAANTGCHEAIWQHPMSDELKTLLESQGYKVVTLTQIADPTKSYRIEGF